MVGKPIADLKDDIRALIDYNWDDEQDDFLAR
jgi:hypothetical protein